MACHLFAAKPLSEPMLKYCQLDPWEQILVKFTRNLNISIQENAFENAVCEIAVILPRPQCVNASLFGSWKPEQTFCKRHLKVMVH